MPLHNKEEYLERLPYRSYLYVAPFETTSIEAAYSAQADAVVFDLEDLTPQAEKAKARQITAKWLATAPPRPTLVRINAHASDSVVADDLDAAVQPGVTALRLPKSESADRIREIARAVDDLRVRRSILKTIGLQVMVESARGIENLPQLARATHTVWSLGIGEGDLKAELRTSADVALNHARSALVLAARSAQLPAPVQVAFPATGSDDALRQSTELGLALGFQARSLISPAHVALVHSIYPDRALKAETYP